MTSNARVLFNGPTVVAAVLSLVTAAVIHVYLSRLQDHDHDRLDFLRREIQKLDKQVDEIKRLPHEIRHALVRRAAIEAVQKDRLQSYWLLDQVVRSRPEGIYLISIKLKPPNVYLNGFGTTSERVDIFAKALSASPNLHALKVVQDPKSLSAERAGYPVWFSLEAEARMPEPGARK